MARRTRRPIAAVSIGFALLLGVEILLARGAVRLDGFSRAELDGRLGGEGRALRIAWIGDSTGDGVGATAADRVLPRLVASGLGRPVELTVLARSGARVADALREQVPAIGSPEWVVVGIGGNDVIHLTSRRRFRRNLAALLTAVRRAGPQRVVVVGIGEFASTPLFAQPLRAIAGVRGDLLNRDIRAAAAEASAVYVDIVGRVGQAFVDDPARMHARDRFHPSDEGYRLWADAVLATLREAES